MLKYSLVLFLFMINLYSSSIKGDSEFEQKNYYKAIKYYKLVTIKEDKYIHIKLAQSYIRLADNFFKIKNYDKAIKLYKKALKYKSSIARIKLSKGKSKNPLLIPHLLCVMFFYLACLFHNKKNS